MSNGYYVDFEICFADMACVVKDPRTKTWRRAKVVATDSGLKLLFVDYGGVIPLDVKIMRRIHPRFLKCPPLVSSTRTMIWPRVLFVFGLGEHH